MASDDIPFSLGNLSETFSHCYYHQLLKEKEKFGPEGLIKTTEEVYALANDGKQMKVIDTLTAKVFKTEAIEIPDEQQQSIAAPEPAKKSKQGKVADIIDVSNVRPGPANPKIQWTLVVPEFGPDGKK